MSRFAEILEHESESMEFGGARMQADIITTTDGLCGLAGEWAQLYERCHDASPFQHPGWLMPWWNFFGSGQLLSLVMRDQERLVAFAPMFLHNWEGRKQITLLGTGISDRLGSLAETAYAGDAAHHLFEFLAEVPEHWDVCDWQDMRPDSPLLDAPLPAELTRTAKTECCCSQIELPPTTEDLLNSLPHGLRSP